jgi:hypothetical protein
LRGDDELPEGLGFEFIEAMLPSAEKQFSVVGACKAQPLLASAELANAYRLPLALTERWVKAEKLRLRTSRMRMVHSS